MPTKKTPQKKASPKIPSDLVYVFGDLPGEELEFRTFISKSDPAFKTLKKDLKYCEMVETLSPVFFPNLYAKSRGDEYLDKLNFSDLWEMPDLVPPLPKGYKTKPNNDLVHLLFINDWGEENCSTLISKSDPYFSKLKKSNLVLFESHEIPIFPKVFLNDPNWIRKKKGIVDYQKFHDQYIADIIKKEQERKEELLEIERFNEKFGDPKFNYELLANHFRVNGIDRKLKEWLMVLKDQANKEGVNPKKMLKDLQSQKSFWEKK